MNTTELYEELDRELTRISAAQFRELGASFVGTPLHYFPFKQNDEGEVFPRKITPEYARVIIATYREAGANAYRTYRPLDPRDGYKLVFVLFCKVPTEKLC